MKVILGQRFGQERALYNIKDAEISDCRFEGEEDGESAMKEGRRLRVRDSFFDLRYPFWHVRRAEIEKCEMTEKCRAALWYDSDVKIEDCKMHGIKALRECSRVSIANSDVVSPEFGWRNRHVVIKDTSVTGEYAFFESRNITADNLDFHGKYSFQYVKNAKISFSVLDTKDAFWHSENVTVTDSTIKGEYLAWYSKGLTLVRCKIIGTQPLCYCRGLKLIDCTMEAADLSFEYSDVEAQVNGRIESVKNPLSGSITADEIGQVILSDSVYPCRAKINAEKVAETIS